MPKLSKQAGIEIIIAELEKSAAKVDIMANFGKRWQTPKDTFNKWWLIALNRYEGAQKLLNDKANDVTVDEKIEAQKTALKQRTERLAILNDKFNSVATIKRGKVKYTDSSGASEIVKISIAEELKAIEVLAKLDERISKADGTDAPTKIANTDPQGNAEKKYDYSKLTDQELRQLQLLHAKTV